MYEQVEDAAAELENSAFYNYKKDIAFKRHTPVKNNFFPTWTYVQFWLTLAPQVLTVNKQQVPKPEMKQETVNITMLKIKLTQPHYDPFTLCQCLPRADQKAFSFSSISENAHVDERSTDHG